MTQFLFVKKRALGDSIMGLSALQYLKEIRPHWHITYAVPAWIYPLYKNVKTAADQIIPINGTLDFYQRILEVYPNAIHEMHQSGSSEKLLRVYSFFKSIPYTFHNHHFQGHSKIIDQGKPIAAIQRDLNGVYAFWGKGELPNYLDYTPKILCKKTNKKNRIIIGAVATRETKMWPLPFVRSLTQLLQQKGYEVSIPVGPGDKKAKHELNDLPLVEIPLSELADYFNESLLYVGNDTGIKHLAVAVGIPSLTFFGPENPSEWHPYKDPYLFIEDLECRTRTAHYCPLSTCDSMICLNQFSPQMVFEKIMTML